MRNLLIPLFFCCLIAAGADAETLPETVSLALKRARIPQSSVSVVVQEIREPKPLISLNAERPMNPASTMKLLTTFAALETLGPAYRWKTEVYLNGKLENGVLDGDLVFKGYGDPKLTIEQFWMWLRELRQRGLREIRGDIVLDHRFFEDVSHDPAEFDNDPTRAYNVGTSALLLNFNAQHLHLIPSDHGVTALLEPDLADYTLVNRITMSNKWRCGGGDAYRVRLDGHNIVLEGKMSAACGELDEYFSLLPQDEYFFAVFGSLWKELGGTLQGKLRTGNAPDGQAPFARYVSPPLSEAIRDINKFSNNIMARQLFLAFGAAMPAMNLANVSQELGDTRLSDGKDGRNAFSSSQEFGGSTLLAEQSGGDSAEAEPINAQPVSDSLHEPGSPEGQASSSRDPLSLSGGNVPASGVSATITTNDQAAKALPANVALSIAAMQQWLKTQQLQFPELVLENGAGLSRKERISSFHLAELLQHAANSPFFAELEASLPILGMDGTVKRRFSNNEIAGYAHLKTGSLEGVKSLAGYVKARSGKQWVVVFIVNHPNAALASHAQDALIEWLQKGN